MSSTNPITADTLRNRPDYANLFASLFSLTRDLSKRHADMLSHETGFTRQKTAAMLRVMVEQGLANTFQDWINGDHIGNNYNLTEAGAKILAASGYDIGNFLSDDLVIKAIHSEGVY